MADLATHDGSETPRNRSDGSSPFDAIRHVREDGLEYWVARELMEALGYKKWEYFQALIQRAMIACENNGRNPADHFFRFCATFADEAAKRATC